MFRQFEWIARLLFLTATIIVAFFMYQRSAVEELWGYRTLWLLFFGWATIVWFFSKYWLKNYLRTRWLARSSVGGLILGAAFPDHLPLFALSFVGIALLLLVEHEISESKEVKKGRLVFGYGYHFFVVWNIISTYWVANASIGAGIFAIMVNALLMTIPFWLYHQTKRVMPRLAAFSFVAYWITFEFNHFHWDLSWPWLALGHVFAEFPSLVQWYEYTGIFGGTLWVLTVNLMIFRLWLEKPKVQLTHPGWLKTLLVLFVPMVFSLFIYGQYEDTGKPVEVAIVQPNFEPHYEKFSVPYKTQFNRFESLAESVIDENTDYLVFPESSFGYVETHQINSYPAIMDLRAFMKNYPELKIVSGMNAYTQFLPTEPLTPNARMNVNANQDTSYYEILNIAVQLDSKQPEIPIYKKSKLVPGPEIFPYRNLLFVFKPIVDKLGGTLQGIGTQPQRSVFSSQSGKVAPVICYESVYGAYFTEYMKHPNNGEAAFIVTNDGWWDNTAGHRQHLYYGSLRAIETRRPIARSANTGVSAFINQRGDILKPTEYGETAAIAQTIFFNDATTIYMIWGDVIARLALFSSILLLLNLLIRTILKNK